MRITLEPVAVIRFYRKALIEMIAYKKYIALFGGFPFKKQLFRKSKGSSINEEPVLENCRIKYITYGPHKALEDVRREGNYKK